MLAIIVNIISFNPHPDLLLNPFIDEETEAQKCEVISPTSHRQEQNQDMKPSQPLFTTLPQYLEL